MAETDAHVALIVYFREALQLFFSERAAEVYVSGNNFVFYEEGNPAARVSPDSYVVFGAAQRLRNSYKCWEEGGVLPAFIAEFTSRKTRVEDVSEKMQLYERLRIPEYFLFDPTGDYLRPALRGYRMTPIGMYAPIEPGADGRLSSQQLRLELVPEGRLLALYDPVQRRFLPTLADEARRAEEESRRAEEESRRAEEESRRAEEESRRAEEESRRAEEESRRAEAEKNRAEAEKSRAEAEKSRAEAEKSRADNAEAEAERLREELRKLRGES
jgi:Uma2 family endonuclease